MMQQKTTLEINQMQRNNLIKIKYIYNNLSKDNLDKTKPTLSGTFSSIVITLLSEYLPSAEVTWGNISGKVRHE